MDRGPCTHYLVLYLPLVALHRPPHPPAHDWSSTRRVIPCPITLQQGHSSGCYFGTPDIAPATEPCLSSPMSAIAVMVDVMRHLSASRFGHSCSREAPVGHSGHGAVYPNASTKRRPPPPPPGPTPL